MFKNKVLYLLLIFTALTVFSCKSRFEQIRESNDVAKKYQEAVKLYKAESYSKALILFEDLSNKYKGRAEAEDLNYYYAYTLYKIKDYATARMQFKFFADTYPNSRYTEECRYMSAYCYYLDSPKSSLDQEVTLKAIESLQLFINLYPKSERVADANKYIAELRRTLEDKAFDNAVMYLKMGEQRIINYRSAVVALRNMQSDYPDTKYDEEVDFLVVKAQYLYASNSLEVRQEDRYGDAIQYYNEFIAKYPNSKFRKEADVYKANSERGIERAKAYLAEVAKDQQRLRELYKKASKQPDTVLTTPAVNK